jgi:hypothetical protein
MEPVRTLAYTGVGAGYEAIGTPFDNPARLLFVQNLTNATLMFSLDGVTDHFALPANGFLLLDITSNKAAASGFFIASDTIMWVKEIGTPSSGSVYVTVMYGSTI